MLIGGRGVTHTVGTWDPRFKGIFTPSFSGSFMALTQLNRFNGSGAESFMTLTQTGRQRLVRLRKAWYFRLQATALQFVLA